MPRRTLTDPDGDQLAIIDHPIGLVISVTQGARGLAAGPFTRAQLTEALDAVAPAGRSTGPHVHHEAQGGYKRSDDYPQGGLVQALPERTRQYLAEQDELRRLGRIVQAVADGDGHTTQIHGVKIAPCDTRGRTRDEVTASVNAARAEGEKGQAQADAAELREKLADAERDRDEAAAAMEQMARDLDTIRTQRDTARADRDAAERERDAAVAALDEREVPSASTPVELADALLDAIRATLATVDPRNDTITALLRAASGAQEARRALRTPREDR